MHGSKPPPNVHSYTFVLSGISAGGLATFNNADYVRGLLAALVPSLRTYLAMLRMEDRLRGHEFFGRAAEGKMVHCLGQMGQRLE